MTNKILDSISPQFISAMNHQKCNPKAQCSFEMFAGGLVWEDESSVINMQTPSSDIRYFRILIAYRSSLIMGDERYEFRSIWQELHQAFPHWLFFLPQRRSPKLLPLLLKLEIDIDDL